MNAVTKPAAGVLIFATDAVGNVYRLTEAEWTGLDAAMKSLERIAKRSLVGFGDGYNERVRAQSIKDAAASARLALKDFMPAYQALTATPSRAALTPLGASQQAAPEGYQIVPIEPTIGMQQAALDASRANGPVESQSGNPLPICYELWSARFVYQAMLAAAPQAAPADPLCPDPAGCMREGCNQNKDGSPCDRFVEPADVRVNPAASLPGGDMGAAVGLADEAVPAVGCPAAAGGGTA